MHLRSWTKERIVLPTEKDKQIKFKAFLLPYCKRPTDQFNVRCTKLMYHENTIDQMILSHHIGNLNKNLMV